MSFTLRRNALVVLRVYGLLAYSTAWRTRRDILVCTYGTCGNAAATSSWQRLFNMRSQFQFSQASSRNGVRAANILNLTCPLSILSNETWYALQDIHVDSHDHIRHTPSGAHQRYAFLRKGVCPIGETKKLAKEFTIVKYALSEYMPCM